jgi:peptidoglycan hydrolase CwlO-like protein
MGKIFTIILMGLCLLQLAGCYSIKVDANVPEGIVSTSPRVDSSRVPKPTTLSESQAELNLAYARIQQLERKVQKLEDDKDELKTKNSRLEKRLERYED